MFQPKRFTNEQLNQARSQTLLSYLQTHAPESLQYIRGGRVLHKSHDSFVVDNGYGQWFWNLKSKGGYSALDYLVKIENMSFVDAVKSLIGDSLPPDNSKASATVPSTQSATRREKAQPRKPLSLPVPAPSSQKITAYLQSRGINISTIKSCINKGILYESASGNCVFIGKDIQGTPKFACERSTMGDTKKDSLGSDKRFGFCIPPDNPNIQASATSLFVFESPIDAMAHRDFVSMNYNSAQHDGYRLSLSGVASAALFQFLQDHPEIKIVYLCLDNDNAGQDACARIQTELADKSKNLPRESYNVKITPPPIGKDYADTIKSIRNQQMPERQRNTQHDCLG